MGNVDQRTCCCIVEMMVVSVVGIEIRDTVLKLDLTQQANISKLVECIIDRGQRHVTAVITYFTPQLFS